MYMYMEMNGGYISQPLKRSEDVDDYSLGPKSLNRSPK